MLILDRDCYEGRKTVYSLCAVLGTILPLSSVDTECDMVCLAQKELISYSGLTFQNYAVG